MTTRLAAIALTALLASACGGSQSSGDPAPIANNGDGDGTPPADTCTVPATYEPATSSDILAAPQSYDGRAVVITGHLTQGIATCTAMACAPDDPCCNSCGSGMTIDGIEVNGLGCSGDSCKLECTGPDGADVQLWGTMAWDGYSARITKLDLCTL